MATGRIGWAEVGPAGVKGRIGWAEVSSAAATLKGRIGWAEISEGAQACILGSVIRATTGTGEHGAGFIYNDLSIIDDAKCYRFTIITPPSAGVFTAYPDGSFTLSGAPIGAYSFTYRLYEDDVDIGTATVSITIEAVDVFVTAATTGTITGTLAAAVDVGGLTAAIVVQAAVIGRIYGTVAANAAVTTKVWTAIPRRRKSSPHLSTATRSNVQ